MDTNVRILHLEDSAVDAELIQSIFSRENFSCEFVRVDNRSDFVKALEQNSFDLILCDYKLPSWDGKSALKISLQCRPNIPFIYVSGTIGEEKAVEALKMGATDYVLKDRIERLVPAVSRALQEAEERKSRKLLEERLVRAQRMESVGILAGGIAHDFNNILGIILGHASIIERLSPETERASESVKAIMKASRRGATVVQQLLAFARKSDAALCPVSLNDVVRETVSLLSETFPKTIFIDVHLQEQLPFVMADATQMHQILVNLCVNARDAMTNGGILRLSTTEIEGKLLISKFPSATCPRYAVVEVADTGVGMTKETCAHIFEPFFTTKAEGKGTGLGLAVAFGIAEKYEGFIDVESDIGRGTKFSLYIPIKLPVTENPHRENDNSVGSVRGSENILIVEDEEMLRELLKDLLTSAGYNVFSSADGAEAVELYEREFSIIDLVVCDFGLPKFDGHEVLQKMKNINPSLKFILVSGYIESKEKSDLIKSSANAFIQKPYLPSFLMQKIRFILDSS